MKKKKLKPLRVLTYIVLIGGVIIAIFPFVWMFLTAFKSQSEAMQIPPTILPKKIDLSNFTNISDKIPFLKIYLNTLVSAIVTVAAQLIFCAMAGYAYARIQFPGKNILFNVCSMTIRFLGQ